MNRRKFFFSSVSIALAGALPASLAAAALTRPGPSDPRNALQWRCLEDCLNQRGQRFRAIGPVHGELRLKQAGPAGRGRGNQFVATFEAPADTPEGLYRLSSGSDRVELFLQPVHGESGMLQAVFNLID